MLKCFATFSVDCGLKASSVFPVILAFNLIAYVYIALKDDGVSSLCISGSVGCHSDHRPVASARLPVGESSRSSVWTCMPTSPGACVRAVPPITPKRVGVRGAGAAPLDGGPETAVTRRRDVVQDTQILIRSLFELGVRNLSTAF